MSRAVLKERRHAVKIEIGVKKRMVVKKNKHAD